MASYQQTYTCPSKDPKVKITKKTIHTCAWYKIQAFQRDINEKWQHDMFEVTEKQIAAEKSERREYPKPTQLYVSNLDDKVSKLDLIDLFSSIGELQELCLHFDKSGRFLGDSSFIISSNGYKEHLVQSATINFF